MHLEPNFSGRREVGSWVGCRNSWVEMRPDEIEGNISEAQMACSSHAEYYRALKSRSLLGLHIMRPWVRCREQTLGASIGTTIWLASIRYQVRYCTDF